MMKSIAIASLGIIGTSFSFAQETVFFEYNNTRTAISNNGILFNDFEESNPGYEYPSGSENHLIYANAFWFGAKDFDNNLKIAAETFGIEHDLFPGALTVDGSATAPVDPSSAGIYYVTKAQILTHTESIGTAGYVIPDNILNWPAHGDVSLGLAYALAPFADLNGNSVYEPEAGEFPEIRGEAATFFIMNDKAGVHENSGGDPIGIELHFMVYKFASDDVINNTTFVNLKVINRSSASYPEFIVANHLDTDIGFYADDYIGCDIENDVMFGYNGDAFDEGSGGQPGYGEDIPAVGVVSLNNPMHVYGTYANSSSNFGDPVTATNYWTYMNAQWRNGAPFRFGEDGGALATGDPVNHLYSGEIIIGDTINWSELSEANPPGDRRGYMASAPQSFEAGEVLCFDYAVIVSDEGDTPYENANNIGEVAAEVKTFYEENTVNYCDFTLGIAAPETDKLAALIYPNPALDQFVVDLTGDYEIALYAMNGKLVYKKANANGKTIVNPELTKGIYLLSITQNGQTDLSKIVLQ